MVTPLSPSTFRLTASSASLLDGGFAAAAAAAAAAAGALRRVSSGEFCRAVIKSENVSMD